MRNSKKKTALITGASRGIGLAIAGVLRKEGVNVIAPARQEMNLFSNESIDGYLSSLNGPVDILINNAGINLPSLGNEVSDKNLGDTIQVNLLAPFRLLRALTPKMKKRQYGRVVNISSIWGIVAKPGRLSYAITKSGLLGMTRTLAVELARYNVLVNAVAPGYVDTELTRANNSPKELAAIRKAIPIGRLASPDEIAEVVAFLASERNSYITGQVIAVDGGYTCL